MDENDLSLVLTVTFPMVARQVFSRTSFRRI
jgi:hypothetical protein